MTEREFENYLVLMGKMLRLDESQREAISDELDDHLEQRLEELISRGMEHDDAIRTALEELGDAAGLASRFTQVSRNTRRRWAMRMTMGGLATAAIVMMAFSLWGPADNGVTPDTAVAQDVAGGVTTIESEISVFASEIGVFPGPGGGQDAQSADSRTMALLAKQFTAEFLEVPLEEFLAEFGNTMGVQTYTNRRALSGEGWDADESLVTLTLKSVPAEMVLELVLDELELTYRIQNGVIIVTTLGEAARRLDTHVYDVRDLVSPDLQEAAAIDSFASEYSKGFHRLMTDEAYGESLEAAIHFEAAKALAMAKKEAGGDVEMMKDKLLVDASAQQYHLLFKNLANKCLSTVAVDYDSLIEPILATIEPESWSDNGGTGSITAYRGRLVISQTSTVHQKIEKLLADLRKGNGQGAVAANVPVGTLETWPSIPAAVPKTLPTPDNTDPLAP